MDNLPEDQAIIDLLGKLKTSNGSYPSEMLDARRQAYQRQITNIGLGLGIGAGLKHVAKGGGNSSGAIAAISSKVLETALVAAITIEAGTATYLYRDKIANAVKTYLNKPAVQEVSSTSNNNNTSSNPNLVPSTQMVTPSEEPSITPSSSPSPVYAGPTNGNTTGDNGNSTNTSANATPNPGGNNGNQYGLTPKPVRTKDTGGSSTTDGGSNNGGGGTSNNGGGNKKP
jgi:hypothetical protein